MVSLFALWLPILVATVVVFLASWVLHTLLPIHKADYAKLPDEDAIMSAGRSQGLAPGQYAFPHMTGAEAFKDPAYKDKCAQGPVGTLIVGPSGLPNMGKLLGLHFLYCLFVSFFVAYVAHAALAPEAHYLAVFRIVGSTAFLAYGAAHISMSVWFYHKWSTTFLYLFDALVFGLLTAGVFGWMWP